MIMIIKKTALSRLKSAEDIKRVRVNLILTFFFAEVYCTIKKRVDEEKEEEH